MPKPKEWTEAQAKHRDETVKRLIDQGYHRQAAYAIATSLVQKERGRRG
jgi:predicted Ser/Thr protein kinase